MVRMGFEPVYFAGGRARHRADHLTVDNEPELVVLSGHGDILPGVDMPTWMRWVATMMEPRWDTRCWTTTGLMAGAGVLGARRAPRSRMRSPGGTGQGRRTRRHAPGGAMNAGTPAV